MQFSAKQFRSLLQRHVGQVLRLPKGGLQSHAGGSDRGRYKKASATVKGGFISSARATVAE
jgi:hypothetical protein